jgi:hypothetical protein
MKSRVLIICILFFSCERIIEVETPVHEPKLVLHGYVATGDFFHVALNQTVRANSSLGGDETFVENAWVLLYENEIFVDSLKYDAQQKRYISQKIIAAAGKTYKVAAGANGFTTVEATARAALPINAIAVDHVKNARTNSSKQSLDDINFSFNDAEGEKNFYLTALYPSILSHSGLICVYSNDPAVDRLRGNVLPFEEGACINNDQILFSDKSFNGKLKEIAISALSESLKTITDSAGKLHRPYLQRSIISEEHYRYLQSTLSMYAGGLIPSMDAPVAIKGNVKNGYGLLTVYPVTTDSLR